MVKTTKKAEPAAKAEAVKTPTAAEAAKTEEKKAVKETKKAPAKAAPKTVKSKAAAKTAKTTKTAAKAASTSTVKVFVEYQGKQMDMDAILEAVKAAAGVKSVKTLEVYVKPEDGAAYYVVNGKDSGKADL